MDIGLFGSSNSKKIIPVDELESSFTGIVLIDLNAYLVCFKILSGQYKIGKESGDNQLIVAYYCLIHTLYHSFGDIL